MEKKENYKLYKSSIHEIHIQSNNKKHHRSFKYLLFNISLSLPSYSKSMEIQKDGITSVHHFSLSQSGNSRFHTSKFQFNSVHLQSGIIY